MPIVDLQQKAREIGRLRIGAQVKTANGKTRPSKLDSFRFTTPSRQVADAVAELYGGTVRPWENGTVDWEVFTTTTEMDVMIPPGDAAVSQWYELWSGGGCQRRCDGVTEKLKGTPCVCPPAGEERVTAANKGAACKPTTRVNVILPDLPDIGVWRYESHGFYAAVELGGAAEMLARAREEGVIVPARLRLEQREVKREGQTRKFAVVVLEINATLRQLATSGGPSSLVDSLPPAPATAIEATAAATTRTSASPSAITAMTAEDVWDQACGASHSSEVAALGKQAREADLLDHMVATSDDTFETLESALLDRVGELRMAERREASA